MSVPHVSLLNVITQLIGSSESVNYMNKFGIQIKYHEALLTVLNCTIEVESLYLVDEVKALISQLNTTTSSTVVSQIIKSKWQDAKETSVNKHLERLILVDVLNHLKTVTTIGRNQLIVELTKATLRHTNENIYDLICYWK